MSWTTVGVFSFWPTSSTSPGFASGWLASTTRLTCAGPFHGSPARRNPHLGVAERDHGVVALVGDGLAPG